MTAIDPPRSDDPANGWDAIADAVVGDRDRSRVGETVVRRWARALHHGAHVLDLGCGGGEPVSRVLVEAGARVTGIDASPRMVAAYRARFPDADVECARAETASRLERPGRAYDAVVAIGVLFLLDESAQRAVLTRMARALAPGGRLLFTAPRQIASWTDRSTGRESRSLGREAYVALLASEGLALVETFVDEGENHYYAAAAG